MCFIVCEVAPRPPKAKDFPVSAFRFRIFSLDFVFFFEFIGMALFFKAREDAMAAMQSATLVLSQPFYFPRLFAHLPQWRVTP